MEEFFAALLRLDWTGMLAATVRTSTPIVLAALGGIFCERSGVINIALEGIMLTGAYIGVAVGVATGSTLIGAIAAIVAGALIAGLHGVLSITYKTDQVISGTVINILAIGLTGFLYRQYETTVSVATFPLIEVPLLSSIPVLGPILFQHQPIVYTMMFMVVITHLVLFRTPWGLRTRAVGEHPRAADTVGIRVNSVRYANVLISGCIAGLGGAWLSLESVGHFSPLMTSGRGFIGLAAMIFGNWSPLGALGAALLFAFPEAFQIKLQLLNVPVPSQFLTLLPYALTIVALAGVVRRTTPPAALGKPYTG